MNALDQPMRRTILLYPQDDQAVRVTTHRLLQQLGHEVTLSTDTDDALRQLLDSHADLLVIDDGPVSSDYQGHRPHDIVSRLVDLPMSHRPREVAVFAHESQGQGIELQQLECDGSRVHLFIKPFHVHGLLAILRDMAKTTPVLRQPHQSVEQEHQIA